MSKKQIIFIIICSIVLTWFFDMFLGRIFLARVSTWPVLNRWNILSPQAPIVITNKETIRISDSGDIVEAASAVKPKLSLLMSVSPAGMSVIGASLNLASDGTFVTASANFSKTQTNYYVLLNDGRSAQVKSRVSDPSVGLTFFTADLNNVPVINFASSKDLLVGEKILFVHNSTQNFFDRGWVAYVSSREQDIQGQVLQSDYPSRSFGTQVSQALLGGEAAVNIKGDALGMWNGSKIISSDALKQSMGLYFQNRQKISKPSFGFVYVVITQNESKLLGQPEGALIKSVSGPSALAGLLPGDIITQIDKNVVNENSSLEEALQKYRPGDTLTLLVARGKSLVELKLKAVELR